jgi:hypothetical protein
VVFTECALVVQRKKDKVTSVSNDQGNICLGSGLWAGTW